VDLKDVRSGLHQTHSLNKILSIYPVYAESHWTDDAVLSVDPERIERAVPADAKLESLPAFVDEDFISRIENQFVNYLLRQFKAKALRNYALMVFSSPGESPEDFTSRCADLLNEPFRKELHHLNEVFGRRLEQIRQKYIEEHIPDDFEFTKSVTENRNRLHAASESMEEMFSTTELNLESPPDPPRLRANPRTDLEERLQSLEIEAYRRIAEILKEYQEKACNNDEYIIHPNLKDIHLVRTCILWMPRTP